MGKLHFALPLLMSEIKLAKTGKNTIGEVSAAIHKNRSNGIGKKLKNWKCVVGMVVSCTLCWWQWWLPNKTSNWKPELRFMTTPALCSHS